MNRNTTRVLGAATIVAALAVPAVAGQQQPGQNLPDRDLDAIYAYLRSIKPVRNAVGRTSTQVKR